MWPVQATQEYLDWFSNLSGAGKESLLGRVLLLQELGPLLGRPYADTLKGSRYPNLKELRAQTSAHQFRVAYIFDDQRQALLLVGGDKKGKNQRSFYRRLVREAEECIDRYYQERSP